MGDDSGAAARDTPNSTSDIKQVDLILATGGGSMVKAVYSSGRPAQGVVAGNAMIIMDETADLKDAADKNRKIAAQPADEIARIAGLSLPKGKSFLMVEEIGIGKQFPFSSEKLSVTVALYRWKEFPEAIDMVNRICTHSGPGHSCGIHTFNDLRIRELATRVRVSRIMIRQPQCLANSGAWTNGMTMTLGCGTWGGNSTSSNVTWEHLLNYTWVSYPIASTQPTDEELFGKLMYED